MDEYEYDVFVSYRRAQPVYRWVTGIFVPILRERLPGVVARDVSIFVDEESVDAGAVWPAALERALLRSRCVVPVLNPEYFQREWCRAEFATMLARMDASRACSVVPIQFNDGEHFDERARNLQWVRMEDFNILPSPSRARNNVGFMRAMIALCTTIAARVRSAPPFDPAWHDLAVRPPAVAFQLGLPGFGAAS